MQPMNDTPSPSPRRQSHPNLPMTMTAFRRELTALRKALREHFGSSFHHAEYGERSSPDNRPDPHNVLREDLDPAYRDQCDLYDTLDLDSLVCADMHGPVVLDLYVYVRCRFGDWELDSNIGAFFRDGKFMGLAGYDYRRTEGTRYGQLLAEVQAAA